MQVSQAEVKNFFERACGEVSIVPELDVFKSVPERGGSNDFSIN